MADTEAGPDAARAAPSPAASAYAPVDPGVATAPGAVPPAVGVPMRPGPMPGAVPRAMPMAPQYSVPMPCQLYVTPDGDRVTVQVVGPAAALLWPPHACLLATDRLILYTTIEALDPHQTVIRLTGSLTRTDAVGPVYVFITSADQQILRRNLVGFLGAGAPYMPGAPVAPAPWTSRPGLQPSGPPGLAPDGFSDGRSSSDLSSSSESLPHRAGSAVANNRTGSQTRIPGSLASVPPGNRLTRSADSAFGEPPRSRRRTQQHDTLLMKIGEPVLPFREPPRQWTENWSDGEVRAGRRLIRYWIGGGSSPMVCSAPANAPPQADVPEAGSTTVISCIYWASQREFYVTGSDFFRLLEGLTGDPFDKELRSRIRRLLEPFNGRTVHQTSEGAQDFFTQVMAYGPPKPRAAVKDFKVYPWRLLDLAVQKVMRWDRNPKRRYLFSAVDAQPSGGGDGGHGDEDDDGGSAAGPAAPHADGADGAAAAAAETPEVIDAGDPPEGDA